MSVIVIVRVKSFLHWVLLDVNIITHFEKNTSVFIQNATKNVMSGYIAFSKPQLFWIFALCVYLTLTGV